MDNDNQLPPAPVAEELGYGGISRAISLLRQEMQIADDYAAAGFGVGYARAFRYLSGAIVKVCGDLEHMAGKTEAARAPVMEFKNWPTGHHVVWECLPYGTHKLYTHPQPAVPEGFAIERRGEEIRVELLLGTDRGHASSWLTPDSEFEERILYWLAHDLLTAAPAKPLVPDVDALAEFIRDMDDGEYIPYHEFAQRICNWIEEQSNDQ